MKRSKAFFMSNEIFTLIIKIHFLFLFDLFFYSFLFLKKKNYVLNPFFFLVFVFSLIGVIDYKRVLLIMVILVIGL